ncbi:MAG: YhbD family protein [Clostridia bacterium]|jgi:hypothetical protein|nr:YhbD family protein [Clostridia bacterium]MBT7122348.1 YhbD family protein [Clostridia bacterium]
MNEELISKKELLEKTSISYGQLYRWKRKGLIPEDWFIRKSTYTGQETFFPRSQVLSRIDRIKNMKDDVSLDDLADVFAPKQSTGKQTPDSIVERGIVSADVMALFIEARGDDKDLEFGEMLSLYIFGTVLSSGDVNLSEAKQMLDVYHTSAIKHGDTASEMYLTRKLGTFSCFALSPPVKICFDKDTKLVRRIDINAAMEELKLKIV